MKKLNIIIISVIAVGVLLIGAGSFYYQYTKVSILKQEARTEYQDNLRKEIEKKATKRDLNTCLNSAELAYWDYMGINGTEDDDGTIWASDRFWNAANKNKKDAKDVCFQQYK